ncbi:MAG: hypothetical protein WBA74_01010, partial [Cyclobacteriaceae bacterium]
YGLGLLSINKYPYHKFLASFFFIWGLGSFLAFGNVFWQLDWLANIIEPYNLYYQAFIRLTIAIWLAFVVLKLYKQKNYSSRKSY